VTGKKSHDFHVRTCERIGGKKESPHIRVTHPRRPAVPNSELVLGGAGSWALSRVCSSKRFSVSLVFDGEVVTRSIERPVKAERIFTLCH